MSIQAILQERFLQLFSTTEKLVMQAVGGGSINDSYSVQYGEQRFFCKINSATKFPHLFDCEKRGLELLADQKIIRTPSILDCFAREDQQFLLLQYITEGQRTQNFWRTFGEKLAALHKISYAYHGLEYDNYMGSVRQQNPRYQSWSAFFGAERLSPILMKCFDQGRLSKLHLSQFDALEKRLPLIFDEEPPSLLHGDLWSGNFLCDEASEPVLIDPAVYFGHRSLDLGMTTLFGGFRQAFYDTYQYYFPLPKNYRQQWDVCNLYPLLIHLHLFGTAYLPPIEKTLKQFA